MEHNHAVKHYYEQVFDEHARAGRESLEFCRAKIIISRYLGPHGMDIADVCAGTGAYAFWLAEQGHRVHVMDLAQNHVNRATERSRESGIPLASCLCGDARALPYTDSTLDMVLVMGALYHLREPESRLACLREALRVLRPGGVALCTVIGRYTAPIAALKYDLFDCPGFDLAGLAANLSCGAFEGSNLPLAYTHTPGELADELSAAGFADVGLLAVEGIANPMGENQLPQDEIKARRLLACIEMTESIPELLGVSRNIMGVGFKN